LSKIGIGEIYGLEQQRELTHVMQDTVCNRWKTNRHSAGLNMDARCMSCKTHGDMVGMDAICNMDDQRLQDGIATCPYETHAYAACHVSWHITCCECHAWLLCHNTAPSSNNL
jgi:hypothetical protein